MYIYTYTLYMLIYKVYIYIYTYTYGPRYTNTAIPIDKALLRMWSWKIIFISSRFMLFLLGQTLTKHVHVSNTQAEQIRDNIFAELKNNGNLRPLINREILEK